MVDLVVALRNQSASQVIQPEHKMMALAADEIAWLRAENAPMSKLIAQIKMLVLPADSYFKTPPEMRQEIYDRLVEILYPPQVR